MTVFDPRLALTFAAVAEEMSFTRAAERLGVAQPWISEQIRRLEERLKRRLLIRTSRRTELTADGLAFLPYAQALARANDTAQHWASEVRSGRQESLRIGAVDFVTDYPERIELIDRFLHANPQVGLQIANGAAEDLLRRLVVGELDAVLAFTTSPGDSQDVQVVTKVCRRVACLMVPREDPIAALEVAPLSAVERHVFVTSPGRSDPVALRLTFGALTANGAELFPAPEANRTTIENLARARRWCCLRWTVEPEPRQALGDMVCIPIEGHPLTLELALLRTVRPERNALVDQLCRIGANLYAEGMEPALNSPFH
jgi:DNA-binding transcriptional LysR family regulator